MRATDRVAASLARRRGRVRDFIRGAARVTEVTGSRNARAERGGPPPARAAARHAARAARPRPVQRRRRAAARARCARRRRASRAACASCARSRGTSAEPLRGLRSTLVRGRRAASTAAPFTRRLNRFLGDAPVTIGLVADLFGDLDRRGFTAEPARALLLRRRHDGALRRARRTSCPPACSTCPTAAPTPPRRCRAARRGRATRPRVRARSGGASARGSSPGAGQARAGARGRQSGRRAPEPPRPAPAPRGAARSRSRCRSPAIRPSSSPTSSRTSSTTCSSERGERQPCSAATP